MPEIDLYYKKDKLLSVYDTKNTNTVPNIIHRLLLYDTDFPNKLLPYLREFRIHNKEFYHVLWKEEELLSIMNEEELNVYNSYKLRIQKSDYGRYIVLKYFGGIYLDFDIKMLKPLKHLYEQYKNDDLFFEEFTLNKVSNKHNETPCLLRIANYIMMHKANSLNILNLLKICKERSTLKVYEEQDVLYTTGPDVVSALVDNELRLNKDSIKVISKKEYSKFILHLHAGHWRFQNQNIKYPNT